MLTPRYFYTDDFSQFHSYFCHSPMCGRLFKRASTFGSRAALMKNTLHRFRGGNALCRPRKRAPENYQLSWRRYCFPGYRQNDYKIELSLTTAALSDMEVLEFTKRQFRTMFETNAALAETVVDWYSSYVNLFLFETVHQEYNPSLIKICNLLYLLTVSQSFRSGPVLGMTQDELAELLGLSRVQITRGLSELRSRKIISTGRGKIEVLDLSGLAELCTNEAY